MDARLPEVPYRPTVPDLLHRAVELYGDGDYVVLPNERLTFREAECRSASVARQLLASGAGKGTRVGILLPTGLDWVVAWLAAARVGALSMLFPATYRPAELRRALAISDVAILVAPPSMFGKDYEAFLEESIPSLAGHAGGPIRDLEVPYLRSIWLTDNSNRRWATRVQSAVGFPEVDPHLQAIESSVSPADPLLVIYTSGSAADPKAIIHTHGAAIRKVQPELGMCLRASFPGRTFCALPFFWVGGPQVLLGALHSGATVVAQPRFEPSEALDLLEREQCTSITGWASLLEQLKTHPTYSSRRLNDLEMPAITWSSRGDPRNLGMTETFGPHANPDWFDYKVIDPVDGAALVDGQEGEFCIRGFGLMAGMYKKEREEVFDADGWYHTGDRGYIEDGVIWFTGRYSEMIKSGGANVSPLEVEHVLEAQPGVALALVLGLRDPLRGETVAAAVVPDNGSTLDTGELRTRASKELSAYKVPSRWLVLQLEDVPVLASGKPNKRALRERF